MTELEIAPQEWLDIFERDYLASFVHEGGAATKVLVVEAELATGLVTRLSVAAGRNGFLTAHVEQTVRRSYAMDRLFNEVAKQIDWMQLASDFMRAALRAHGCAMPEGSPASTTSQRPTRSTTGR